MSLRGAAVVYGKELKDVTRDRRTIISMVLVPILFYPLISIGLGSLIASQIQKTRAAQQRILVLPERSDPDLLASLAAAPQLELVPVDSVRTGLLRQASPDSVGQRESIGRLFSSADPGAITDSLKARLYFAAISAKWVRAVVELPPDFAARLRTGDSAVFGVYTDETDLKSETAGDLVRKWANGVRDSIVGQRLTASGMDRRILTPFTVAAFDVAPKAKKTGYIAAMFLPYMLMILTLTGGMYPALDITAGEKERNTLETLLAAPVARWQLAIGKFLTVLTAGFITMLLATASMTISMGIGGMQFSSREAGEVPTVFAPATVGWMILLMLPMAVLFSALLIAVSISARSYKEGQSYVTPLLMVVIMPAMVSFIPGVELNWSLAWVPVVNLCLTLKDVLMGTIRPALFAAVLFTTVVYAGFCLFVAARVFERESVLFRT
ncbi:MAG: ABC transporter permease subunit [Candidatus Zixiibacteriota bacterium]